MGGIVPMYSMYSYMYCVLSTTVYMSFTSLIHSGTLTLQSMLKFNMFSGFFHSLYPSFCGLIVDFVMF